MAETNRKMAARKPRIGITVPDRRARISWNCIRIGILLAGGVPLKVTPKKPRLDERIDGLVLAGGTDIYPPRYGNTAKQQYRYDHARDEMELAWLQRAEEQDLPMLGICRGAQLMNVHRGGNLHLDVSKVYEKAHYPNGTLARIFYRKRMHVRPASLLFTLIGEEYSRVNSLHTQAINELGAGLEISGEESNRVVQAVEDPTHRMMLGVQFHPEYLIYARRYRNLFNHLVRMAKIGLE